MARQVRNRAANGRGERRVRRTKPTTKSGRNPLDADKTWQQTKSENTRTTILDAAIDCFYDIGYAGATTEQVARRAGVSRGAMLHHFRSRFDLIAAAVEHLNAKRLALFEREEMRIQRNAKHTRIAEGIDSYWRQLNTKLFVVFHELQVAARTDAGLRKIMLPAITKFDERWLETVENVFPDLSQSKNFVLGNFLTLFLLEGMAGNYLRNPGRWTQALLDDLKQRLANELFADVTGVDRSAKPRHRHKEL
jgi:AcrR family transcriptional regulator